MQKGKVVTKLFEKASLLVGRFVLGTLIFTTLYMAIGLVVYEFRLPGPPLFYLLGILVFWFRKRPAAGGKAA